MEGLVFPKKNLENKENLILDKMNSSFLDKNEIQNRRNNFNKAAASVALEGFHISEATKEAAEMFIQGKESLEAIILKKLKEDLSKMKKNK